MNSRLVSTWLVAGVFLGLTPLACSQGDSGLGEHGSDPSSGSVGLSLQVAPGTTLNSVTYVITGPGGFTKTGSIDVTHSTTVSALIGGIPAGTGYTISLSGTSTAGDTSCQGAGSFDVVAGQTNTVSVHLTCHGAATTGSVLVNGALNLCPVMNGIGASPAEVYVGSSVSLTGQASDPDAGPSALSYQWTAPSGTFSNAASANPQFTCQTAGPVDVTLTVSDGDPAMGCAATASATITCTPTPLQADVQTIVVIYAENRTLDSLFGNFPGAHGLSEVVDAAGHPTSAYHPQVDRDGTTVLPKLPQTWGGATAAGNPTVVTQAQTDNLANAPFPIESAFVANGGPALTTLDVTRDMAHRFFENQMEINGGTNDMFAAWLDAGGLTMGHVDNSHSALYALAQEYVLADNFFEGAFGGSFLNHQYLICGCAPTVPASFVSATGASLNTLAAPNGKGVPQLVANSTSPASALDGPPSLKSGNVAPLDYFGAGDGYRAVNTMQPAYQPSGNFPASGASDLRYANPSSNTTLPAQTQATIGDELTSKGIGWAWYATSWDAATTDGAQAAGSTHTVIYAPSSPRGNPDFQAHHHPYNYYAAFDPGAHAADRAAHLKDYTALLSDISAGTLPPVVYYKPTGYVNQHPGYANVNDGDAHIANLIAQLKASSQWAHMVIVVTYDEYGGQYDHVAPPKGDLLGPGSRIPALIVSPYAKAGTVDHTQYDTASIIRLITNRFNLAPLPGVTARDAALVANGGTAMGDLTNALALP